MWFDGDAIRVRFDGEVISVRFDVNVGFRCAQPNLHYQCNIEHHGLGCARRIVTRVARYCIDNVGWVERSETQQLFDGCIG